MGTKQRSVWLLSQSYFGWPSNRPRLYTILVLKQSGKLDHDGLHLIDLLYRVPKVSSMMHLVAPQVLQLYSQDCSGLFLFPFCILFTATGKHVFSAMLRDTLPRMRWRPPDEN